jgi:hypothetical protein
MKAATYPAAGCRQERLAPEVKALPLAEGLEVFMQIVTAPPDDYIKAVLLPQ